MLAHRIEGSTQARGNEPLLYIMAIIAVLEGESTCELPGYFS